MSTSSSNRSPENVQVIVRCRPLNQREIAEQVASIARAEGNEVTIEVKARNLTKTFSYDAVYGPSASQRDIYQGSVLPIVEEVLAGYNCTIFAYGQTGTGKTYTMEGSRSSETSMDESELDSKARLKASREAGVISRAINTIFETLAKGTDEYAVKVSHLEIYNEELYDLLDPSNKGLKIFEDPGNPQGAIQVKGLTEANARDIFSVLEKSWLERRTAETILNDKSSRSHCIFSITIHMKERAIEGEDLLKVGKLNLVDLAGSENVARSGTSAKPSGRTEAGSINKSLLAFGRVITALVDQSPHVPYRESKLTRLLQDSLGGRTKTCIIATISPGSPSLDETIGTLEYAHRAKSIRNQPQVNAKLSKKEYLGDYAKEIDDLRGQLDAMRRKDGVYLPHSQYVALTDDIRVKAEEIDLLLDQQKVHAKELDELHELFDEQTRSLRQSQDDLNQTQQTLASTRAELQGKISALEGTQVDLQEHKIVLQAHQETEQLFQLQAQQLQSALNQALAHVAALHAAHERRDAHAAKNSSDWLALRAELDSETASLISIVQEYVRAACEDNSNHRKLLQNIVLDSHAESQEQIAMLDRHSHNRVQNLTTAAERARSGAAADAAEWQRLMEWHDGARSGAEATLHALTESVEQKGQTLHTTLLAYEARTRAWTEARSRDAAEGLVAAQTSHERQQQLWKQALECTNSHVDLELTASVESKQSIQQFVAQHQERLASFEEKILKEMTHLVHSFTEAETVAVAQQAAKWEQRLAQQIERHVSHKAAVGRAQQEAASFLRQDLEFSALRANQLKEAAQKLADTAAGIAAIEGEQLRSLLSVVRQGQEQMSSHESQGRIDLSLRFQAAEKVRMAQLDSTIASLRDIGEGDAVCRKELESRISTHSQLLQTATQRVISLLQVASTASNSFGAVHASRSTALGAKILGFSYPPYTHPSQNDIEIENQATPIRRKWEFPDSIAHTRSAAELLAEFRNGGPLPTVDPLAEARKVAQLLLNQGKEVDTEDDHSKDSSPELPDDKEIPKEQVKEKADDPKKAILSSSLARAQSVSAFKRPLGAGLSSGATSKAALVGRENGTSFKTVSRPVQGSQPPGSMPHGLKRTVSQQPVLPGTRKPAPSHDTVTKQ